MIVAQFEPRFESWRAEARRLLLAGTSPDTIVWSQHSNALSLFSMMDQPASHPAAAGAAPVKTKVSPEFLSSARMVSLSNDETKWALLYRILFRLSNGEPELMNILIDNDVMKFNHLLKSVHRDLHKMHAFVRFKEIEWEGVKRYVAWHKPEHPCLEEGAQFFVRRFGDKPWSIFTPDESAHWDCNELTFTPGIAQNEFQVTDEFDELWKSYYSAIFNPARIKIKAMKAEMSPKYWQSLPEVEMIRELVRDAPRRIETMAARQNIQTVVPKGLSLPELKTAAHSCRACPLYASATQTVFGEGPINAKILIVGEQPGDQEDQSGRMFVGPAGEMLNECLRAAGLDRDGVYITNAVKHFKWRPGNTAREGGGKARVHQKPSGTEMHACRPWLEAEIDRVKPEIVLALGATAGTSVLGRLPKITQERGQVFTDNGFAPKVILSWHPAAILRSMDPEELRTRKAQLTEDLRLALSVQSTD